MQKIISLAIIITVTYVAVYSFGLSLSEAWEQSNFETISKKNKVCYPVTSEPREKKVVLRLDDIQAFAYKDISEKMIDDALERKIKMVLGVIPNKILEDEEMLRFLEINRCNLEIAMHGWDHITWDEEIFEFENISEEETKAKIQKGKDILEKISRKSLVSFIPPGNKLSYNAKKALEQEGIKYISADNKINEYGMDATTFNFEKKELVENSEVLKRCEERFNQKKNCVIVLHPQDYLTEDHFDVEKYKKYIELLEELKKQNIQAVTFEELDSENITKSDSGNEKPISTGFEKALHPSLLSSK